jgi:hypothetical protein
MVAIVMLVVRSDVKLGARGYREIRTSFAGGRKVVSEDSGVRWSFWGNRGLENVVGQPPFQNLELERGQIVITCEQGYTLTVAFTLSRIEKLSSGASSLT